MRLDNNRSDVVFDKAELARLLKNTFSNHDYSWVNNLINNRMKFRLKELSYNCTGDYTFIDDELIPFA